jgi:hypothetical protein
MPSGAKSVIKLILHLLSNIYVKKVLLKRLINSITMIQKKRLRLYETKDHEKQNPERELKKN